jgi:hypothetical protein
MAFGGGIPFAIGVLRLRAIERLGDHLLRGDRCDRAQQRRAHQELPHAGSLLGLKAAMISALASDYLIRTDVWNCR